MARPGGLAGPISLQEWFDSTAPHQRLCRLGARPPDSRSGDAGANPAGDATAGSARGRPPDSDSGKRGSNPCPATSMRRNRLKAVGVFTVARDASNVEERVRLLPAAPRHAGPSSSGRTPVFEAGDRGSNPRGPTRAGIRSGGTGESYKHAGQVRLLGARPSVGAGCSSVCAERLAWNQEGVGSNPAIPTMC